MEEIQELIKTRSSALMTNLGYPQLALYVHHRLWETMRSPLRRHTGDYCVILMQVLSSRFQESDE